MSAGTGHGSVLTFGTQAFAGLISQISGNDVSLPAIEVPHLQSQDYMPKIKGDIRDHGAITVEGYTDPNNHPVFSAPETVAITFPLRAGQSVAAYHAGTAFITNYQAAQNIATNEPVKFSLEITWDGKTPPETTPAVPT